MQTYKTLITVRGLRRADPLRAREPIGEGEVIALPDHLAGNLCAIGALEGTDAPATVELALIGVDFARDPDQALVDVSTVGIRPTDIEALAQALEALGALVLLPGEGLAGRDIMKFVQALKDFGAAVLLPGETVGLDDVLASDLMDEISARIAAGAVSAADLPESVIGLAATVIKVPEATLEAGGPPAGSEPLPPVADAQPPVAATAPAKPARKGKA
ncbi:hypothetical protein [Novosphingobium sp. EMRT-2]|uniref:hypothetical protein n=1 Tax=Novosphingobium sp. EMRT-2 TaxID=2571749 RepID=UPI0010BD8189|nr:hypothetical protein [Novosphingobium sp. EMRT-2]QCI93262.1 hypothetical protein FA702_06635 [Novosphingobium sp. EMRT-2]